MLLNFVEQRTTSIMFAVYGFFIFFVGAIITSSSVFGFEGKPSGMALGTALYTTGTIIVDLAMAMSIIPPSKADISATKHMKTKTSRERSTDSKSADHSSSPPSGTTESKAQE